MVQNAINKLPLLSTLTVTYTEMGHRTYIAIGHDYTTLGCLNKFTWRNALSAVTRANIRDRVMGEFTY